MEGRGGIHDTPHTRINGGGGDGGGSPRAPDEAAGGIGTREATVALQEQESTSRDPMVLGPRPQHARCVRNIRLAANSPAISLARGLSALYYALFY